MNDGSGLGKFVGNGNGNTVKRIDGIDVGWLEITVGTKLAFSVDVKDGCGVGIGAGVVMRVGNGVEDLAGKGG